MSDTLGETFNFYYFADDMVTDVHFVDAGKDEIVANIMDKLQVWYVKQIHDKVTATETTTSTIQGWTNIMNKVDMQSVCKNGRYFDLIDADSFNLALTKYIDSPYEDMGD